MKLHSTRARAAHAVASSSVESETAVVCPRCGAAALFFALPQVGVLDGDALARNLAVRPDGWVVDVRACTACRAPFARKVSVGACGDVIR
jgi:hypothetical protein